VWERLSSRDLPFIFVKLTATGRLLLSLGIENLSDRSKIAYAKMAYLLLTN